MPVVKSFLLVVFESNEELEGGREVGEGMDN